MCGRFVFKLRWKELHDLLNFGRSSARLEPELKASYNVAPTQLSPIVYRDARGRVLELSRWGFVPAWWSQPAPPAHAINARSETVATSGLYRGAFAAGRCVVPVSGFYEWQAGAGGAKRPVYITRADGMPLLLAGLHDGKDGVDTFAICTTSSPHGFAEIHDRSPVVVEPEDVERWLDAETPAAEVKSLCRPAGDGVLRWHEVRRAVGNVRNNSPELIEEARGRGGREQGPPGDARGLFGNG